MLRDESRYNIIRKPERNRIVDNTLIPSYGKFEVHNKKFTKLMKYITDTNKYYNEKIKNPSVKQKALNQVLKQQLDLYRLKVLYDNWKRVSDANDQKTAITELMLYMTSFRAFCGPGTDIYKQIKEDNDNPSKMFKVDTICRNHDIAFTHAKTLEDQHRADEIFMRDVVKKYFFDFDSSGMFGKNPQSFDTWSDSMNSIMGYAFSTVEGLVSGSMVYGGYKLFKNAAVAGYGTLKYVTSGIAQSVYYLNQLKKASMGLRGVYVPPTVGGSTSFFLKRTGIEIFYALAGLVKGAMNENILKLVQSYFFTNLIKDKILSTVALAGIAGKYIIEKLTLSAAGIFSPELAEYFKEKGMMIDIVSDEVSEEDINGLIEMFTAIQNEILSESNIPNIEKITEEDYDNIHIEDDPEIILNDFKNIMMMQNENITTRFDRYVNEPEPEYTEEEIKEAEYIYNAMITNPEEVSEAIDETTVSPDVATEETITGETITEVLSDEAIQEYINEMFSDSD